MKDDVDNPVDWPIDKHHLFQLINITYPKIIIACKKHAVSNKPLCKVKTFSISPLPRISPPSNKPPRQISKLTISPRGLDRGFTVHLTPLIIVNIIFFVDQKSANQYIKENDVLKSQLEEQVKNIKLLQSNYDQLKMTHESLIASQETEAPVVDHSSKEMIGL